MEAIEYIAIVAVAISVTALRIALLMTRSNHTDDTVNA